MAPSYAFIESILQWTLFLVIISCFAAYSNNINSSITYYWIEITGVTVCAINSYFYHGYLYKLLSSTNDNVNVLKEWDGVVMYYIDLVSILMRSFFGVITKMKHLGDSITSNEQKLFYFISFLHIVSAVFCYFMLRYIYNKKMYVTCRNNIRTSQKYISVVHIALFIPIGFALWFITLGCTNVLLVSIHSIHTLITGLITFFKPFGIYNHLMFHILIIVQGYLSGSCNQCVK
jgi:hypothetical protein